MFLFWNKTQFYLDALPDNQELAQHVDWLCWRRDLQKIRRRHRLAPPPTDISRGETRGKDYCRPEDSGREPRVGPGAAGRASRSSYHRRRSAQRSSGSAANSEEGRGCQFLGPRLRGVGVASAVGMLVRKDAGRFAVSGQGCGVCACVRVRVCVCVCEWVRERGAVQRERGRRLSDPEVLKTQTELGEGLRTSLERAESRSRSSGGAQSMWTWGLSPELSSRRYFCCLLQTGTGF